MGFYTRTKQPVVGKLAEVFGFDEETNTLEVGGNLYVDGEIISGEPTNIFNLLNITAKSTFRNYNYHTPYNREQVIETLLKYNINGFVVNDRKEIGKIEYIDSLANSFDPGISYVVVRALNGSWEITFYNPNPSQPQHYNNIYFTETPKPFKTHKYNHAVLTENMPTIAVEVPSTLDIITDFKEEINGAVITELYRRGELLLRAKTSTGDTFTLFPFLDKVGPTGTEYEQYKAFYIGLDNSVNIVSLAIGTFYVKSDSVSEIL